MVYEKKGRGFRGFWRIFSDADAIGCPAIERSVQASVSVEFEISIPAGRDRLRATRTNVVRPMTVLGTRRFSVRYSLIRPSAIQIR
jgi:hypothetical protein